MATIGLPGRDRDPSIELDALNKYFLTLIGVDASTHPHGDAYHCVLTLTYCHMKPWDDGPPPKRPADRNREIEMANRIVKRNRESRTLPPCRSGEFWFVRYELRAYCCPPGSPGPFRVERTAEYVYPVERSQDAQYMAARIVEERGGVKEATLILFSEYEGNESDPNFGEIMEALAVIYNNVFVLIGDDTLADPTILLEGYRLFRALCSDKYPEAEKIGELYDSFSDVSTCGQSR